MKLLFLDESGDHSLDKIDPTYPIFVLGGVIVDKDYAEGEMTDKIRSFKQRLFGGSKITLHTADITRNRNGFERMKDEIFRKTFHAELNQLMQDLEYKVVACAINKAEHLKRHGLAAIDPYLLSLHVLIERFCFEVGRAENGGMIIAEKRNSTLDAQLELAWLNIKIKGTRYMQPAHISRRIESLVLRDKKAGLAGLELADLVVTPIGRHVMGKPDKPDFKIIETKFRRETPASHYTGKGLVILPKK